MLIYVHKDLRDFLATGGNAPLYIDIEEDVDDVADHTIYIITLTKLVLIAFRTTVADVALAVCKITHMTPNTEATEDTLVPTFDKMAELIKPLMESTHEGIMCAPGLGYNALNEIDPATECPVLISEWKEMIDSILKEIEEDREKMKLEMQEAAIEQDAENIEIQIMYLKRQIEQEEAAKKTGTKLQHPDGRVLATPPQSVTKDRIIEELRKKQADIKDKMKQPPNIPDPEANSE